MLTVNDLMTVTPLTIPPDTPLRQVIYLMQREGVRQLPVVDNGELVGIITDRDVRLAVNSPVVVQNMAHRKENIERFTAETCMTPNPMTVTPEMSAYKVAEMLATYKFGAFPVLDNGTLVGIITVSDYLTFFATLEKRLEPALWLTT
ncbi:MAG: CBS domain-containing protein [Chloroflexi bacterium]|nr:CBS domain-containing protein [Chloroflexota bacterium]MBP8059639.1 CBS domain-containing protein [Chloroflexota bacterium]